MARSLIFLISLAETLLGLHTLDCCLYSDLSYTGLSPSSKSVLANSFYTL